MPDDRGATMPNRLVAVVDELPQDADRVYRVTRASGETAIAFPPLSGLSRFVWDDPEQGWLSDVTHWEDGPEPED